MSKLLLLLLLVPALMHGSILARAQEDETLEGEAGEEAGAGEEPPLDDAGVPDPTAFEMPQSDVRLGIMFPDYPNRAFPAGALVTAVVGFHNRGEETYTIIGIDGSLRHPLEFTYRMQNFTVDEYSTIVDPNYQSSFVYKFRPLDRNAEPRDIGLAIDIHYKNSDGQIFRESAYNTTIKITDSEEPFDFSSIFSYGIFFAVIAGAYYLFVNGGATASSKPTKTAKPVKKVETGTSGGAEENEWLVGTHATPTKRSAKKYK